MSLTLDSIRGDEDGDGIDYPGPNLQQDLHS